MSSSAARRWIFSSRTPRRHGEQVSVLSLPYLIATKFDAIHGRGNGDFMGSKDLEDIVALLDGCPDAERKILAAPADVRKYLATEFQKLQADKMFQAGLEGHLGFGRDVSDRLDRWFDIARRIAASS
ncbi:MAG: nucleotidyl transferase AbiEii/AbiGii toxin family protein [Elusimicrobia bacterium]|nr:nucleotidyl transferase AbiEii/AbiGii toxin family protein [Elusimicrobiota bacterium]